jgi:hypothetical protein
MIQRLGFKCNLVSSPEVAGQALSTRSCQILIVNATMFVRNIQLHQILFCAPKNYAPDQSQSVPRIIGILPATFAGMKDQCLALGLADILIEPLYQDALYECICYVSNQDISSLLDIGSAVAATVSTCEAAAGSNISNHNAILPLPSSPFSTLSSPYDRPASRKRICSPLPRDGDAKVSRIAPPSMSETTSAGWMDMVEASSPTLCRHNASLLAMLA